MNILIHPSYFPSISHFVAIAKADLDATQVALLRETGIAVITSVAEGTDVAFTQDAVEELAEKIVELVRL